MAHIVQNGDAVMLYNVRLKKFLAQPQLEQRSGTDYLTGIPTLTDDPSDVGLLLISTPDENSKHLHLRSNIILRAVTGKVAERVYLGADSRGPETLPGQPVYYMAPNNPKNIIWKFQGETFDTMILYGVSYTVQNASSLIHLQGNQFGGRLVAVADSPDGPDSWILLPTTSIYTCQAGVNDCVMTRGFDNAFSEFRCTSDPYRCLDRFKQSVFFDLNQCIRDCYQDSGSAGEPGEASATSQGLPVTNVKTAGSASMLYIVVTAAILGSLVGIIISKTQH